MIDPVPGGKIVFEMNRLARPDRPSVVASEYLRQAAALGRDTTHQIRRRIRHVGARGRIVRREIRQLVCS